MALKSQPGLLLKAGIPQMSLAFAFADLPEVAARPWSMFSPNLGSPSCPEPDATTRLCLEPWAALTHRALRDSLALLPISQTGGAQPTFHPAITPCVPKGATGLCKGLPKATTYSTGTASLPKRKSSTFCPWESMLAAPNHLCAPSRNGKEAWKMVPRRFCCVFTQELR